MLHVLLCCHRLRSRQRAVLALCIPVNLMHGRPNCAATSDSSQLPMPQVQPLTPPMLQQAQQDARPVAVWDRQERERRNREQQRKQQVDETSKAIERVRVQRIHTADIIGPHRARRANVRTFQNMSVLLPYGLADQAPQVCSIARAAQSLCMLLQDDVAPEMPGAAGGLQDLGEPAAQPAAEAQQRRSYDIAADCRAGSLSGWSSGGINAFHTTTSGSFAASHGNSSLAAAGSRALQQPQDVSLTAAAACRAVTPDSGMRAKQV